MPPPPRVSSRRLKRWALVLVAGVFLAVLLSLAVGSRTIPFSEVLQAVFTDVDSDNATVITSQRLPRTVLGVLAGLSLGMSGALMQGHTRNPLADPGLFGVNAGATFAVAVVVFGFGVQSAAVTVLAAMTGAGVVTTLVFLLGLRAMRGGALVMLAVLGTTLAALLAALTSALILLDRDTLDVLRFWEVGALANRPFELLVPVGVLIALGIALALGNSVSLTSLALGEDVAQSLGTRVRASRITGIASITLLAGPATAMCGPIAFLGLVAPHVARAITRHDQRWLIPFAGLIGIIVLLVADTIGRVSARPGELQVGIVMALVGAPVLLVLTRRRRLVPL
jgi:iron complex transport system permease protein